MTERSGLITSAWRSPSDIVAYGPAKTREKSAVTKPERTRYQRYAAMPVSASPIVKVWISCVPS